MSEETTAKSAAASKRLEAIAAKHSELIEQIDWSPVQALDALRKKMAFTPFEDRGLNRAEYDFLRWVRHEADGAGTPWSRYNAVHDRRSMQHGKYLTYKLKQLIN